MKKFALIFLVIVLLLFIISKVLEIDIVGYFEREVVRVQYVNSQQQSNIFNETFDPEEQTFTLFDENCNKFGPYTFTEAGEKLKDGLFLECKTIDGDELFEIENHQSSYISSQDFINNVSNLIYDYPGFEGDEVDNWRIQLAVYQLPQPFRKLLLDEVKVINGCHPYGEALYDRCVYGVFDPLGYGADGRYGNDWEKTIWISDRGMKSGHLQDILLHEAAHAYSYSILNKCFSSNGGSFRELAHERFGNEENFADAFVHYYGGKWTNYVQRAYLESDDNKWFTDMIEYCDWYIDCKEQLEVSF